MREDFVFNSISPTCTSHSFPDASLKINMQTYVVAGCKRYPKKFMPIGKEFGSFALFNLSIFNAIFIIIELKILKIAPFFFCLFPSKGQN